MPSKKQSKTKRREIEHDEESPSTRSFDIDEDESSTSAGFNVTAKNSKKRSKKSRRGTVDSFVPPTGQGPTLTSWCHPRIFYLISAVAAVIAIGFGAYLLLNKMGWLPTGASQHKDFQGTVTASELTFHDTSDDCWVVYYNKVYVMTDYAGRHPGGSSIIQNMCGADGTGPYEAYHPESLLKSVQSEFIGDLVADEVSTGSNTAISANMVVMSDVELHNTDGNCWVVYSNQVYDMSDYAKSHPGGSTYIYDLCGADGTSEYGKYHKESLLKSIKGNLVGSLAESSTGTTSVGASAPQTTYNGGSDDSEDDTASAPGPTPVPAPGCLVTGITVKELQQHNTADNCWLEIDGTVYDLTNYGHPGSIITNQCRSQNQATKSFSSAHNLGKLSLVAKYEVGKLSSISGQVPC
mmetsp:Transcript_11387/g.18858  ORF Transcript_11387/g.18858 Transcript_11387/m.18858 type:complete len:408 (-) Transcript_11387:124-1347(-)